MELVTKAGFESLSLTLPRCAQLPPCPKDLVKEVAFELRQVRVSKIIHMHYFSECKQVATAGAKRK